MTQPSYKSNDWFIDDREPFSEKNNLASAHFVREPFTDSSTYHEVGGVARLVERRSLAGELSLSCARPAADG